MSGRTSLPLCWLGLLLVAAAFAGACGEHLSARFPHAVHLTGAACGGPEKPACLSCNSCHTVARRDTSQALPAVSLCQRCHRDRQAQLQAVISAPAPRPYGAIRFDHDQHLALPGVGGQCVSCHAGVVEGGQPSLPPMATCFGCHEHEAQWRRAQCAPCHVDAEVRRLLPQSFLPHRGDFARHHGTAAAQQKQLCQACHQQADCDGCHDTSQDLSVERRRPEAIERGFVHRGDFLTSPALEAQSQPAQCLRCHATETCDACHLARGVSGGLIEGRNPHPPGWVGNNPNARSLHAEAARRDILLCASCHDQGPATNCIRCHKVGGYGGNPHPAGWKSTRSESSQMCRYCHV